MRKFVLSLAALALVASPAFAGKYNKTVSVGDKAPEFSGIPATLKGEDTSLTLSDAKEDVVVLVFLGIHCPFVVGIEDRLNDFAQDYKGKSVKLVGVSVNDMDSDRLPAIQDWVKEHGSQYVYGYDDSQQIAKDYGAVNTPSFFVLDKDRKIAYMGAFDNSSSPAPPKADGAKNYVRDAVDALLAGKAPEVSETRPIGCGMKMK